MDISNRGEDRQDEKYTTVSLSLFQRMIFVILSRKTIFCKKWSSRRKLTQQHRIHTDIPSRHCPSPSSFGFLA